MTTMLRESDALSSRQGEPWLSLIGLGEDGAAGLCRDALAALNAAEIVFGGERHVALVGSVPGELRPWPQPFRKSSRSAAARSACWRPATRSITASATA